MCKLRSVAIKLHPQQCQPQNKHVNGFRVHLRKSLVAICNGETPRTMDLMPNQVRGLRFPQNFAHKEPTNSPSTYSTFSFMHYKCPQVYLRTFFYQRDGAQKAKQ